MHISSRRQNLIEDRFHTANLLSHVASASGQDSGLAQQRSSTATVTTKDLLNVLKILFKN